MTATTELRLSGASPEKIDALQRLYDSHGLLTKPMVVEAARPAQSPLHDEFDWDDSEAAERWRLEQAGQLFRRIKVVITQPEPKSATVNVDTSSHRAWVNIPSRHGYVPLTVAVVDHRQEVIDDAVRYLRQAQAKLAFLNDEEMMSVVRDLDEIKRRLGA